MTQKRNPIRLIVLFFLIAGKLLAGSIEILPASDNNINSGNIRLFPFVEPTFYKQVKQIDYSVWFRVTNSGTAAIVTCDNGVQDPFEEGIDCGGLFCPPCDPCSNGIQDVEEEGIDCGGPNCLPCATCNDNIKNGQETGVDCGGPDCPVCPTCFDGVKNGKETGIDCGGPDCAACPSCDDNIKNGSETGVDCGGPDCAACPTCDDNIQNGAETGVDCGGPECPVCPTCDDEIQNQGEEGVDCGGPNCAPCPTCDDNIQNGAETGVDCGGPDCPVCPTCDDEIQNQGEEGVDCGGPNCAACPTCDDNIQNGAETGVDCGGPDCRVCPPPCNPPTELTADASDGNRLNISWNAVEYGVRYAVQVRVVDGENWYDFTTGTTELSIRGLSLGTSYEWRVRTICEELESTWSVSCILTSGDPNFNGCPAAPTCDDNIQNGSETGVDCGGPDCVACPTCDDNIQNGAETGIDCGGPDCAACPTCDDNIQNGAETGIDCGGPDCVACPTCDDNIQNGSETGVDCGGPDCAACPLVCDAPANLFADGLTNNRVQLNWDASADAEKYAVQVRVMGSDAWYDFVTSENRLSIRGVSDGTAYEWRVRTICPELDSDWSFTCNFIGGDATSGDCGAPTCEDGIQNGDETGIDCGGTYCAACPTCDDNIQNGAETGIDCGGPDCAACPTCDDNIQNGAETGVDCGGPACTACPTCDDNIQNGEETGVDCGGPDCIACPVVCNAPASLFAENSEPNRVVLSWSEVEDALAYEIQIRIVQGDYRGSWYNFRTNEERISIRGTSAGTQYEWQVRTVCETLSSEWTEACIFEGGNPDNNDCTAAPTCEDGIQNGDELGIDCGGSDCMPCPCIAPTELSAAGSVLFPDAVFLSWNEVPGAMGYIAQVRRVGDPRWRTYDIYEQFGTSFSPDRSDSQVGVQYEWRVRSVCGEEAGNWSVICTYVGGNAHNTSVCSDAPEEDYTCDDGIQNGYETDIDCGGPDCGPCPTCDDNIQNGEETGVDCGAPGCRDCPPACDPPYNLYADDFQRNSVRLNWIGTPGALYYKVQLRGIGYGLSIEVTTTATSILLGNAVPFLPVKWWVEAHCTEGRFAKSVECEFRRATNYGPVCDPAPPTCEDGIQNGDETGIDCGGPDCEACPTCDDNIQNGEETGVDCGGPDCVVCPTCDDEIQNQGEEGIDCGGPCATCPTCEDEIQNGDETGIDCGGSACTPCPTCDDNIQNGEETGIDCGAPGCRDCPPPCDPPYNLYAYDFEQSSFKLHWNASPGAEYYKVQLRGINYSYTYERTTTDTTLQLGYEVPFTPIKWWVEAYCTEDKMSKSLDCEFERNRTYSAYCDPVPSCENGIQDGAETGIDCGGPDCPECLPDCYAPYNLFADAFNLSNNTIRLNWNGSPGARYYRLYTKVPGFATTAVTVTTTSSTIYVWAPGSTWQWWVEAYCYGGAVMKSATCTFNLQGGYTDNCTPPTCEDGIQNGEETGIDCGGSTCPICPTCEDNIQNGDETWIDCGGMECEPCPDCGPAVGLYASDFEVQRIFGNVQLNWKPVPGAQSYKHIFTLDRFNTQTINVVSDTFIRFERLRSNLRYRWWVEATCYDGKTYKSNECTFLIITSDTDCPGVSAFSKPVNYQSAPPTGGLSTWPNPTTGELNISLNYPNQKNLVIRLRDLRGTEVLKIPVEEGQNLFRKNVSNLPVGIYFLTVSNGEMMESIKVVISEQ